MLRVGVMSRLIPLSVSLLTSHSSVNDALSFNLLPLNPGELIAGGLAALRLSAVVLMLPVLASIPWRARIGIAVILGAALSGTHSTSVSEWSWASIISELLTGASLGIGLRVTLSALQSAGTWVDEQTATGLSAEPVLPESDENTSGSAQVLSWIGAWLILTSAPWGADLAIMQHAIDSLGEIPLGTVIAPAQLPEWCVGLLRGWSHLAIGVALPVCLVAGLLQAGLSMVGRGLGVGVSQAMSPLRAGLTCLLLVVVLPWQATRIDETLRSPPIVIGQPSNQDGDRP